jgi:deoxyribodipyrimidine photo-lyase
MIANRRTTWNFSMDRAVDWARDLGKPLVVLEALRSDYPWASDRIHRFILDGMIDNACRLSQIGILHHAWVERRPGEGRGLLEAVSRPAAVVVTDDYPCFFLPRMIEIAARRVDVRMEAVDSNGLFPMRAADRDYSTAHAFRRMLQRLLPAHLDESPRADSLADGPLPPLPRLPDEVYRRWPSWGARKSADGELLAGLPIEHSVVPVSTDGGSAAGSRALCAFLERLPRYLKDRNHPDADGTSGLSPYLHFGHLSVHEIYGRIAEQEGWSPHLLSDRGAGRREGWWGMSHSAEAFLDQLVTWRELGFNFCAHRADYDQYESLPAWARRTLAVHAADPRSWTYTVAEFESALTHDTVWNAAQRQLMREGRIHNYLRMLWGKKILEWSKSPEEALAILIQLNNKYALDGRDPNSYSGIFWTLGRYDRPWGPERPVMGTVRYMTSQNTVRKVRIKEYLRKYGS